MIHIASVEVQSFSLRFLDVFWQAANTTEDIAGYTFRVRRSESPEGPFEYVSPVLMETFSFRDESANLASIHRVFYYQIEVTHSFSGEVGYSRVGYLGYEPDPVVIEMARLHQLQLRTVKGLPVLVLKRRTTGPSCPFCYDEVRRRSTDSECLVCLGTNQYRGGFLDPIGTFANETPDQKALKLASITESETSEKVFDMTGYPLIGLGDVFVTKANRRFRTTRVTSRSAKGFVYRQIVQTTEIQRTDAIYKLEIDPTRFPHKRSPDFPLPDIRQLEDSIVGFSRFVAQATGHPGGFTYREDFVATAAQTVFPLRVTTADTRPGKHAVVISGFLQLPEAGNDYTLTPSELTVLRPMVAGQSVTVFYVLAGHPGGFDHRDNFVGDGITSTFTLTGPSIDAGPGGSLVSVAGIVRRPGDGHEYAIEGLDVVFVAPPGPGVNISALYSETDSLHGYDAREDFVGDGVNTVFPLRVQNADPRAGRHLVVSGAQVLRQGMGADYVMTASALRVLRTPHDGGNLSIFYMIVGDA